MKPLVYAPYLPTNAARVAAPTPACDAASFSSLALDGARILSLDATAHFNLTVPAVTLPPTSRDPPAGVDVCLVTIRHGHPDEGDGVTTWVALPLRGGGSSSSSSSSGGGGSGVGHWNGRFLASGGGGWLAGDEDRAVAGAGAGFASVSTDGGHAMPAGDDDGWPAGWALRPDPAGDGDGDGVVVNWPALEDFASRALVEAVRLGKQATEAYYGEPPRFSYWNGCSTGGRQGHVMAQKIPEEFDGIAAGAPAINWAKFMIQEVWGYVMASTYGIAPPPCVFEALTSAAVDACDELDGVKDGVISLPGRCDYDPSALVGETVDCSAPGANVTITQDMANLARDIWTGPTATGGESLWYGLNMDASLAGPSDLLPSNCTAADDCALSLFEVSQSWVQVFLQRQPARQPGLDLPRDRVGAAYDQSVAEYAAAISTDDPDLSRLGASGAKMIVWHGLADNLIPPNGSTDYYDRVAATWAAGGGAGAGAGVEVDDFYRLFLAPGVGHCHGGPGLDPFPEVFFELVRWVEDGVAPATLAAAGPAVGGAGAGAGTNASGAARAVGLCPYPSVLTFTGADPNDAGSFECL